MGSGSKPAEREIWRALFFYDVYRVILAAVAFTLLTLNRGGLAVRSPLGGVLGRLPACD